MTQNETILKHLENEKGITPIDALTKYGCFRLSARVNELRKQGYYIETIYRTDPETKKTYAEYRLGSAD